MVIVTISWQLGIDGERVGAMLGERLGLPVVDGEVVDAVMHALRTGRADAADMERFVPTWSPNLAVSLPATAGMPAARADVILARSAHTAVEAVIRVAARHSCVSIGRGGIALMAREAGGLRADLENRYILVRIESHFSQCHADAHVGSADVPAGRNLVAEELFHALYFWNREQTIREGIQEASADYHTGTGKIACHGG